MQKSKVLGGQLSPGPARNREFRQRGAITAVQTVRGPFRGSNCQQTHWIARAIELRTAVGYLYKKCPDRRFSEKYP
jgi:hypothetical protein